MAEAVSPVSSRKRGQLRAASLGISRKCLSVFHFLFLSFSCSFRTSNRNDLDLESTPAMYIYMRR